MAVVSEKDASNIGAGRWFAIKKSPPKGGDAGEASGENLFEAVFHAGRRTHGTVGAVLIMRSAGTTGRRSELLE